MKKLTLVLWILFGAIYGFAMRLLFAYGPVFPDQNVVSLAFLLGTPVAIGAIVVYGLRNSNPSIASMIFVPWISVLFAMFGSAVALLEGSVCIALAAPIFLFCSSFGGLAMGLILRWIDKSKTTFNSVLALPLALAMGQPMFPVQTQELEERTSVDVAAEPARIWHEILEARDIRSNEIQSNVVHWIGVPRPLQGLNVATPEGEVRYSTWERGVHFSAEVTDRIQERSITWRYRFEPSSFPKGSLDDHVAIGGRYFDLKDTTFNLLPISAKTTRLEIVSHFRVTTDINFYGVPVARFIAQDFMSSILSLYKHRSERGKKT